MLTISKFDRLLYAFTGFVLLLIAGRMVYFNSLHYAFLGINLFLAWIPYYISRYFTKLPLPWLQWGLMGLWLLFLPNAFYIVTDLIHLRQPSMAPVWLDALIVFSAAMAGMIMALASLYRAEKFLTRYLKAWQVQVAMAGILLASGFGVYLGRFLRWYSWDVVAQPLSFFSSVANRIAFPHQHLRTWAFTFVLAGFFWLLYAMVKRLPFAIMGTKKEG
jgi:uncharacterized membrane protein